MGEGKRFYWIKLKTDFFDEITTDWLLSQKNGCQYVVLYLMLCLKTANSDGLLATNIGEMIIPYDVEKIVRDTKYFDFDTVTVGLELFKKLGLIYVEENNVMRIANVENMVGSEAGNANAQRQKRFREKKKMLSLNQPVTISNASSNVISNECSVTQNNEENRDKSLENRDKSIDINIPYKEIVDFLNLTAGTKYKSSTPKTKECIKARWNEGFRLDDFKTVISKMSAKWMGTDFEQYLRPQTLFGTKFENYLNSPEVKKNVPDWYEETQGNQCDENLLNEVLSKQSQIRG